MGYPAPYRVAMSNLGFQFIYGRFRNNPGFRVERFFSDTAPLTLESQKPVSSARALIFSISYEDDYLELVRIIRTSGMDPRRRNRKEGPVIVAGGIAVSANPVPLSGIADVIALGEGETVSEVIMEGLENCPPGKKERLLDYLAGREGVFLPERDGEGVKIPGRYRGGDLPVSVIVSPETVFADTYLMEIARGCPGRCSFCLASVLYSPWRFMACRTFQEKLSVAVDKISGVGLVSTAVAAHPGFVEIMKLLLNRSIRVSLSSIRAEDMNEEKAGLIGEAGIRSVSLAPESGSEQLRYRLGKRVDDRVYAGVVRWLAERGVKNFTIYLITGIPGEEDSLQQTRRFIRNLNAAAEGGRVNVHLNILVPKPGTPMQFYPLPPANQLNRRIYGIKSICLEEGVGFKYKSVRSSIRQALLSLGGEGIGEGLIRYSEGGTSWRRAMEDSGVDIRLPHLTKGRDWEFPHYRIYGAGNRETLYRRFAGSRGE